MEWLNLLLCMHESSMEVFWKLQDSLTFVRILLLGNFI